MAARPPSWLTPRAGTLAVLIIGLAARALLLSQIDPGPAVWQHRLVATDMHFFDLWARQIAAGDWLGREPLHPLTDWHVAFAKEYFATTGDTTYPTPKALWDHWYGERTFHQEPLYPYLVALTYRVLGPDVRWVFLWQMAAGLSSLWLILRIGRRHFGEPAGTIAGLLAAAYAPLLYYEVILERSALLVLAGLVLVEVADRARERGGVRSWLTAGLACGASVLLKSTFALFAVGLGVALTLAHRREPRRLAREAGALAAGIAIALVPLVARNAAVGAPPFSISAVGAITFVNANAADYPPDVGFFASRHAVRIMAESDGRLGPAVLATLKTHPGPVSYLRQLAGKVAVAWGWYELPNNTNFYYYRLHLPVLRYGLGFWLLSPLCLLGLALTLPAWRKLWPLQLLIASGFATLLAFYVLSRFRLPIVAAMIPLAGYSLAWIGERVRAGRLRPALLAVAAIGGLGLWSGRPLPERIPLIRSADYVAPFTAHFLPEAEKAAAARDWAGAAAVLSASMAYEPPIVRELASGASPRSVPEAELAGFFSDVHRRWAVALENEGKPEAAAREARIAAALEAAAYL